MPKPTNQPGKRPLQQPQESPTPKAKDPQKMRNTILVVAAILLIIGGATGTGIYLTLVRPFQRVIIRVDNDTVKIGYFLKRVLNNPSSSSTSGSSSTSSSSSSDDIWGTMQTVTYELIVKQEASKFGINITDADIDKALRQAAQGSNASITDAEYNAWYRQQLNYTTYTNKELREVVKRSLEMQALQNILADRVPNTAEQGHLWSIVVSTYDEALAAKQRVDNGESFQVIAKELSIDSVTKDSGGDLGWVPFGILDTQFSSVVSGLDVGECSDPVLTSQPDPSSQDPNAQNPPYAVFWISQKDPARQLTDAQLQTFKAKALQDWLNTESGTKKIEFYGLHGKGGYDSETEAWLNYQLQRLHKAISGTTSSTTNTTASQGQ